MEQKKWGLMLRNIVDKIKAQSIVPIIGPDVFYVANKEKNMPVHEWIVRELLSPEREFARVAPELLTEENIRLCLQSGIKGIHQLSRLFAQAGLTLTNQLHKLLVSENRQQDIRLNDNVRQFLESGEFPLVITTNYFQTLCNLITCNGIGYNVVAYKCENNKTQDIVLSQDDLFLSHPTIFHLFGVARPGNRCVLTEDDFLMYIQCLQDTNTCPSSLRQYLRNKYILAIGCNIPDWTFRMLLYSLKEREGRAVGEIGNRDTFIGGAVNRQLDSEFVSYLERIKYYSDNNIYDFLDDINRELLDEDKPSIFLSVCSDDYDKIGRVLSQKLKRRFKVWFCKERLNGKGGEEYWEKIREGLEECRYFMPVITPAVGYKLIRAENIKEPLHDQEAGIITEWKYAFEVWQRKYSDTGEKYCFPYLIGVPMKDFRMDLQKQFDGLLYKMFVTDKGNGYVEKPLKDFSADDLSIENLSKSVQ